MDRLQRAFAVRPLAPLAGLMLLAGCESKPATPPVLSGDTTPAAIAAAPAEPELLPVDETVALRLLEPSLIVQAVYPLDVSNGEASSPRYRLAQLPPTTTAHSGGPELVAPGMTADKDSSEHVTPLPPYTPPATSHSSPLPALSDLSLEPPEPTPAALTGPKPGSILIESRQQSVVNSEESSRLPWASSPINTPEMNAATSRVEQSIQRGMRLAERGAVFSARSEFIAAVNAVAVALDAYHGTIAHSTALAAGLHALEEADDFAPRGSVLEAERNLEIIVRSHRTPVLKGEDRASYTRLIGLQRYYTYAEQQLAVAVGKQPVGAQALYALGRMQTFAPKATEHDFGKAVVYYQAALAVNPNHALAANELGVLLARFGQYDSAKLALQHSAKIAPQAAVFRNLATVHERLGEPQMAQRAKMEAEAIVAVRQGASGGGVQWLPPETFAKSAPAPVAPVAAQPSAKPQPTTAATTPDKKSASQWFPWMSNRK